MFNSENGGSGMFMPVAPAYGYGGGGFGGFGNDGWWIILLLLAWGGNFGGGFGNGMWGMDGLYPWLNNSQNISGGFRDQFLNDNITGIRSDIGNLGTQLCNGFNQTQMTTYQTGNAIQAQAAQIGCDNRMAIADLKYTIANEGCQTRSANAANTQAVLDKLCQLELDGYKREADNLRSELTNTKLAATFNQGMNQEVDALYNRLSNCPVPTTPVYGRTPIFTCNNNGCGCGN